MIRKILLYFFIISSFSALAEEKKSQDIGKSKAEEMTAYFSSFKTSSGVKNNLQNPLLGSEKLNTLDGKSSFNAQLGCQSSSEYLKATIAPTRTGDVRFIAIEQDTSMDGEIDTVSTPDWVISGVCANGFISCSAGSWDSCRNMIWTANKSTNQIGAYEGALTDLGGCYCINNSCGTGLAWSNLETILGTLGGGIASALASNNSYYAISNTSINDTTIKYYGSDPASCSNNSKESIVETGSSSELVNYKTASVSEMKNAGTTALSSSNLGKLVLNSQFNSDSQSEYNNCSINRVIPIDEIVLDDIIGLNSGSGSITACGSDCLLLTLGRVGDDYISGNCRIVDQAVSFYLKRPDRVLSANLLYAAFDDWIQVRANNHVFWSGPYNNWNSTTSRPPGRCELSTSWKQSPRSSFLQYMQNEGNVDFLVRTEVTGRGEGYVRAQIKVDTECKLDEDYISDSCEPYRNDKDCVLVSETVDGVEVYKNYTGTGLTPINSTKKIKGQNCSFDVTRDWFNKDRVYICKNDSEFDINSIIDRKSVVSNSAKNGDSEVEDIRYDTDKGIVNASINVTPYTAYTDGECTQVCKTRELVPQNSVSTDGITGAKVINPTVYQYEYRECDSDNVCPANDGEEVIHACACSSEFSNATAIMQTLRVAGQDLICTSGKLQPME